MGSSSWEGALLGGENSHQMLKVKKKVKVPWTSGFLRFVSFYLGKSVHHVRPSFKVKVGI